MPVNPFFNHVTAVNEQNLVNDLIVESIQIYGHSAFYVRREDADLDRLFGEDPLAHYDVATEIEVYLKSNISFQGPSESLSKFGLIIEDDATFLVSVTRFAEELGDVLSRPRENDIVYIEMSPKNRFLFEIKFVENKEQLFQLGRLYVYELQCQLMNYGHERVNTDIPEINTVAEREAYTIDLPMSSGNGIYQHGETVYQGATFLAAIATGVVVGWASNTLSVQSVTGEFAIGITVVGISSNAQYVLAAPADLAPKSDKHSDNDLFTSESPEIVLPRHNPRYNS